MHQLKYAKEIPKRFDMATCKAVATPSNMNLKLEEFLDEEKVDPIEFKQIVGSFGYICNSWPVLYYAVGVLSRFMNHPRRSHYMAAKGVIRYVQGTMQCGIIGFHKDRGQNCCGCCCVSWCSKKQPVTTLSTFEAEYVAGAFAACQAN